MNITATPLDGLLIVEPCLHEDARGYFFESWAHSRYAASGMPEMMKQDNLSWSRQGVLRGLHFQNPRPQAKLVSVLAGEVYDVAVDVRADSPTFGRWFGVRLSAANRRQVYIPSGFAHGFCVTSDAALVSYKCSEEYDPRAEFSVLWNDPALGIDWPISEPQVSAKDAAALPLGQIPRERLPRRESR